MAIDWANEPYVRLYKRETDDDLLLTWEARAVWHEMLKRFDRSGLLETRRGVRGLAAMIRIPIEVVERVLQELLEDGRVRSVPPIGFAAKNYILANDTPRTDRARQAESRNRRIQTALSPTNSEIECHAASRGVTPCHTESRGVTHIRADQSSALSVADKSAPDDALLQLKDKCDALNPPLELTEPEPKRRGRPKSNNSAIPENWEPRQQERELCARLGLNCESEAAEFKTFWLGDGRTKKDWNMTFQNRLYTQANRPRFPRQQTGQPQGAPRKIKTL